MGLSARDLYDGEAELTWLMQQPGGLRLFIEESWQILEPATPFYAGWNLDAVCDHLEAVTAGDIHTLIITVPPRHMKSLTVAVNWPCWEWGPAAADAFLPTSPVDHPRRRLPSLKWLFSSYAQGLSTRDSQKRRQILNSPWYRARWGHIFTIGVEDYLADGAEKYENSQKGYHLSTSVGGKNTGEGGDRIVTDDPIKVADANSDIIREKVNDWNDQTMYTRANDPKTVARVYIMQRTHERDLVGHLLARWGDRVNMDGDHVHLNIPTEYEGPTHWFLGQDPRTEVGQLMWPERFDQKATDESKESLGPLAFASQHQGRPGPASGAFFQVDWLRFYALPNTGLVGQIDKDTDPWIAQLKSSCVGELVGELPPLFGKTWQSVDAAFKELRDNDKVAIQMWSALDAYHYLRDQRLDRMSFTRTIDQVLDQRRLFPACRATLVEDKANGPAIVDALRRKVRGIREVPAVESKVSRAGATHDLWRAGQVWLPHPAIAPWVKAFVAELLTFPFAANDDQVDAMAHALIHHQTIVERTEDWSMAADV